MGRWQNKIKQALYRPTKSHAVTSLTIDVVKKLGKELSNSLSQVLTEKSDQQEKKN